MDFSVGILSKINIGELPYINVFMEYYIKLGIRMFYFMCEEKEIYVIKEFLNIYKKNVKFNCVNFTQDYLLFIEPNEFLNLKLESRNYGRIQGFLRDFEYDKYYFDWIIVVNDGISNKEMGLHKRKGKVMVKVCKDMKIMEDDIDISQEYINVFRGEVYLYKYWTRTFNDMIIKCIIENKEKLDNEVDNKILPHKFKVLAVLSKINKKVELKNNILDKIDYNSEEIMVQKFDKKIELEEIYKKYMDNIKIDVEQKYIRKNLSLKKIIKLIKD